jgi:hypothetical protein
LATLVQELQHVLESSLEWPDAHLMTESGGGWGELSEVKPDKYQVLVHYLDIRRAPDGWRGWTASRIRKRPERGSG